LVETAVVCFAKKFIRHEWRLTREWRVQSVKIAPEETFTATTIKVRYPAKAAYEIAPVE
jgi:hypothetical protein